VISNFLVATDFITQSKDTKWFELEPIHKLFPHFKEMTGPTADE